MAKEKVPNSNNITADDSSISPVNPFEGKDGDSEYNKVAKDIRTKTYGVDVREGLARSAEGAGVALTQSIDASDKAVKSMKDESKKAVDTMNKGIKTVQDLLDWKTNNEDKFNKLVDAVNKYGDTPVGQVDSDIKNIVQQMIYQDTYYEYRVKQTFEGWVSDVGIGIRAGITNIRIFSLYSNKARNKSGGSTGLIKKMPPAPFDTVSGGKIELINNSTGTSDGLSGLVRINVAIGSTNYFMTLDNYYQGDNTIGYSAGKNITKKTSSQIEGQYYFLTNSTVQLEGEYELMEKNATYIRRGAIAKTLAAYFGIEAPSKG